MLIVNCFPVTLPWPSLVKTESRPGFWWYFRLLVDHRLRSATGQLDWPERVFEG
jgi:hypothetical protein